MTQWARIENGIVVELTPPRSDGHALADCYTPEAGFVPCPGSVAVGQTFDGAAFGPPPPPDPAVVAAAIKATAEARLSDVREAAIAFFTAGAPLSLPWKAYRTAIKAIIANPGSDPAAVQWPPIPPMPED